jgi:peptidoglycan-N-acetylglucosamine deacetylase
MVVRTPNPSAARILSVARAAIAGLMLCSFAAAPAFAACSDAATTSGLPVSRTIAIDASTGPVFGTLTDQAREPSLLKPKEVVLTFDDGPMPWVTKSILDTLDRFCTKATFFSVGRMALAYPATIKDVIARGHTLGTHTYSHPFNMPRMKADAAHDEIERGIAAVATAAGTPIAPFFRFTGLAGSDRLVGYLKSRGIATFTVDVVSNDSYISDKKALVDRTLAEVVANKGGIILFHDIKTTTAKALPEILAGLKTRGYSVVHLTPKSHIEPLPEMLNAVMPKLAKASPLRGAPHISVPFYGTIGPEKPGTERPGTEKPKVAGWTKRGSGESQSGSARFVLGPDSMPASDTGWITRIKPVLPPAKEKPAP